MLTGSVVRYHMNNGTLQGGDTDKATTLLFHKLANSPEPSLRVAIGLDSNNGIKQKLKSVEADITKYESWFDSLHLTGVSPVPIEAWVVPKLPTQV